MDLTRLIPPSWPIRLGDTTYLVPPLRLRDIARLQAWLAVARPCPLEAARPGLDSAEGEARRAMLVELYAACEAWPIRYGSAEGAALLSTRAGAVAWLAVVLARAEPTPTDDEVAALAGSLSPDEWRRLAAVALDSDPLDELVRMIDPPEAESGEADDLNWGEAFSDVAESTGWTFDAIADLTLAQWVAIRTGGTAERGASAPREGESVGEAAARRRRLFFGDDAMHPTALDLKRQSDAEALFAKHGASIEVSP